MKRCYCDYCGKELTGESESRYVVRLEAMRKAEAPAILCEADLECQDDPDHIEQMERLLDGYDSHSDGLHDTVPDETLPVPQSREFDFCTACYGRFQADPLGLDRGRNFSFSAN